MDWQIPFLVERWSECHRLPVPHATVQVIPPKVSDHSFKELLYSLNTEVQKCSQGKMGRPRHGTRHTFQEGFFHCCPFLFGQPKQQFWLFAHPHFYNPIDGIKSKLLAASTRVFNHLYSLANYEVVYLVYQLLCCILHVTDPALSSWSAVLTEQPV